MNKGNKTMTILARIHEISKDPWTYGKQWKEKNNKPVLGHFCTYTPEEIVYAAGALPYRIFGSTETISLADAHLQAYSCSLVRGGLEEALKGKLDFLDGTVFPHTCDSIQRLSDIWRLNCGFSMHFDVVLPVKLNTDSARIYMTDVLNLFKKQLESNLNITITDESLKSSIDLYNRSRALIKEIYEIRETNPEKISGNDINALLKCAMFMDRMEFTTLIEEYIKELNEIKANNSLSEKKRIVLAGGICNHPDIYTILEESGSIVIWDELCTGTRYFEGAISSAGDPLDAIAQRYYDRVVCPAKHSDLYKRSEELKEIVEKHNAQGVIFIFLKFCDPHSFDYPFLKKTMDQTGIPTLLLEIEETLPPEGQLRTRFETFSEML
jgi:benzoyl-CoA reductase subunit C